MNQLNLRAIKNIAFLLT